jgi:hypothetical protein
MPTDGYLTFEDGIVRLGKDTLPGIFRAMDISAGVRFDRALKDHMSGKAKVPLGWEDSDIKLTSDLLCDAGSDCYDKLTVINGLFRSADKGANPKVYEVTGRHLRARGIKRVVFSGLESRENDDEDVIQVTLAFSEHIPAVVKREKRVTAQKTATPKVNATAAADPAITLETSPFLAGFNTGNK